MPFEKEIHGTPCIHKFFTTHRISENERTEGQTLFEDTLQKLERVENEEKEKCDIVDQEAHDAELHSKMFVEHMRTGKLFDAMYEHDEEGTP